MSNIVSRRLRLGEHTPDCITWREKLLGINDLSYPVRIAWREGHRRLHNNDMAALLEELHRLRVLPANYLTYLLLPKAESPMFELYASIVKELLPLNIDSFSTHLLRRDNPFVFSRELLDLESQDRIDDLFRDVRAVVEGEQVKAGVQYQRSRQFLSKLLPIQKLDHPAIWWQKYLKTNAPDSTIGASKTTLLLAYELKIRNKTVEQLHEKMQKCGTKNPQAILF